MPNLLQSLGRDYFDSRCEGSMFFGPGGSPSSILRASRDNYNQVIIKSYTGKIGRITTEQAELEADFFSGLEVLRTPELGWRTALDGKYLAFLSRNNRGYTRGVTGANLTTNLHPMSMSLIEDGEISNSYFENLGVQTKLVMEPDYLTLAEGMASMREGNILSFAMSASMALVVESDEAASLLLGRRRVGSVSFDGTINCTIPYVRANLEEPA